MRHLCKHIRGNPTVVVKSVPGAGGMKIVNEAIREANPEVVKRAASLVYGTSS